MKRALLAVAFLALGCTNSPHASDLLAQRDRRLRCCDETVSPTCLCEGPRRGCCSHHGGVCGCE